MIDSRSRDFTDGGNDMNVQSNRNSRKIIARYESLMKEARRFLLFRDRERRRLREYILPKSHEPTNGNL